MSKKNELLKGALLLTPKEKAMLIEELIKSLDSPDETIDALWKQESESRIEAYKEGELKALSLQEVFTKYKIETD